MNEKNLRIDPPDLLSDYDPPHYEDPVRAMLVEEPVDAMEHQPYLSVSPRTTVGEAVELLHQTGVSSLLVVEEDRLRGIFTERDVLEKVVERYGRARSAPVEDYMTVDPTIVYGSDPSAAAIAAIAVAGHRHVPVLDMDEKVQGVVSPRRVFQFINQAV